MSSIDTEIRGKLCVLISNIIKLFALQVFRQRHYFSYFFLLCGASHRVIVSKTNFISIQPLNLDQLNNYNIELLMLLLAKTYIAKKYFF